MRDNLAKLIEEQRTKMPDGITKVELLNFKYEIVENKLIVTKITLLSINDCDIPDIAEQGLSDGPVTIYFDNELEWDDDKYKDATFDETSLDLYVNGKHNSVRDYTEVMEYASDFQAKSEQVLKSIMTTFIKKQRSPVRTISGRP